MLRDMPTIISSKCNFCGKKKKKKKKKSNEELEKVKNDRSCCFFLPLSVFVFLENYWKKTKEVEVEKSHKPLNLGLTVCNAVAVW